LKRSIKKNRKINSFQIFSVWLFLFIFLFKGFLSPLIYSLELTYIQYDIKEKLLQKIPDSSLIKIHKVAGFDDHEFELDGKMYDVVRYEMNGDEKILYCFEDEAETALNLDIKRALNLYLTQHPFQKDISLKIQNIINSVFSFEAFPAFNLAIFPFSAIFLNYRINNFSSRILSILSPPPQLFFLQ
jgi:hypothetical protein